MIRHLWLKLRLIWLRAELSDARDRHAFYHEGALAWGMEMDRLHDVVYEAEKELNRIR